MKQLLQILTAAALAGAGVYVVVSGKETATRDESRTARVQQLEQDKAELRRQLQAAQSQTPVIVTAGPVVAGMEKSAAQPQAATPGQIIALLQELKPTDKRVKRRLVYYLESLVERGDPALPAMAAFLDRNVDLEFPATPSARGALGKLMGGKKNAAPAWNYFRPFPKPAADGIPATLRLGLLEAVAAIGTTGAEELLLKILDDTARGVEVAYLEIALQELARDQHVDKILAATRRLLTKLPPVTEDSMAVDRRAKGYLYAILVKYNDRIFVPTAKTLLITADGRLDGDVLAYLRHVLGAGAMPIYLEAAADERLTNAIDRYAIRDAALHYIEQDPRATALLMDSIREGLDAQQEGANFNWGALKLPFAALTRGVADAPDPAEALATRERLIGTIRDEFNHSGLNQALDKVETGLRNSVHGTNDGGDK